jgi:DNA-directed RNA polymerase III subunit RPC3
LDLALSGLDGSGRVEYSEEGQPEATTLEILDELGTSVNVAGGIGKVARNKIDFRSAEKVQQSPRLLDDSGESDLEENSDTKGQVGGGYSDSGDEYPTDAASSQIREDTSRNNGDKQGRVKFDDLITPKDSRVDLMRQHLLLLAENKYRFIRHCGTQGRGQWTVDFDLLMQRLREAEVDTIIERSFGRQGLRLTRILKDKGKLDEKTLGQIALIKKSDVQGKMLALQMAGIVGVQEVPKDNSRTANRTMFFWFCNGERTESQLLDNLYKTMLRCLQTLEVERHRVRGILSFVDRKDVKGKEEEVMTAEHYNKYRKHLDLQDKLLGHVARLDDLVAVLRDY